MLRRRQKPFTALRGQHGALGAPHGAHLLRDARGQRPALGRGGGPARREAAVASSTPAQAALASTVPPRTPRGVLRRGAVCPWRWESRIRLRAHTQRRTAACRKRGSTRPGRCAREGLSGTVRAASRPECPPSRGGAAPQAPRRSPRRTCPRAGEQGHWGPEPEACPHPSAGMPATGPQGPPWRRTRAPWPAGSWSAPAFATLK